MPTVSDTAYPRLKSHPTERELETIYTPTLEERYLAQHSTKGKAAYVGFLILLKTFQRLGYPVYVADVPAAIIQHIVVISQTQITREDLIGYDVSSTRKRHLAIIRAFLNLQPYRSEARTVTLAAMEFAILSKHDLVDLINIAIEELVRQRYELPGFSRLLRTARQVRHQANQAIYQRVSDSLTTAAKQQIDQLLQTDNETRTTDWNALKQDPGRPTITHLKVLIQRLEWLSSLQVDATVLADIPEVKLQHFATEASQLDASRMRAMAAPKKHTLAAILLKTQYARTLDDLAEMFIRQMQQMHQSAKDALAAHRVETQSLTETLLTLLRDILLAFQSEGTIEQRFRGIAAVIGSQCTELIQQCESLLLYREYNYFPFLQTFYKGQRATLFKLLEVLPLQSSTQDNQLQDAVAFIQTHRQSRHEQVAVVNVESSEPPPAKPEPLLELDWIPPKWWHLVTGQPQRSPAPTQVYRRHLEVCVFSQVLRELKSGDLYVAGSHDFANYYDQLLDWSTYRAKLPDYSLQVNLPTETPAFLAHTRQWLATQAAQTDQHFPANTHVDFQRNRLVIHRTKRSKPKGLAQLKSLIEQRLPPVNLLDTLIDTELWLNWTRFFKPKSGHDAKLDQPIARYLSSTFCYGCNLGPTQAARSLLDFDRHQVAYAHQHHMDVAKLQRANERIINAYNQFALPKHWGDGKSASVDGTKWDIYENNLLAEYHIRYGGYGGIAYYHVSDTYIALFSHFIPCGVWEAIHLLDGLLNNQSDIQPNTIHGDTQAQSATVFALAYLLGIRLMPRIRNWKDLKLYRPAHTARYRHIDSLFAQTVNWELIKTYLPDMLRVAVSVKEGKIRAATILRKLGTQSSKNRLYQAFHELGCAVRSGFILQYIDDADLRATIQAATNKSEAFNKFAKWLSFGENVITTNNREEQRKIIRYNHLVANSLIFHNVFAISQALQQLVMEGYTIESEAIAALSPYWTQHVNRFGIYDLDLERHPPTIDYQAPITSPTLFPT